MNNKVAILLVNWNGYNLTRECIESLLSITYNNFQIYVVDNGSTDGSYERLKTEFPNIALIRSNRNLGFSGGNNLGIKTMSSTPFFKTRF